MRIDKYLKVSRIMKRRTVANELAANQRVEINGKPVKPSHEVKAGDIVGITFGTRTDRSQSIIRAGSEDKERKLQKCMR